MTTYLQLQTEVSRDLADPSNQTFDINAVKDFIQQGLAEVGRIAPEQFQEDLTPVADQLVYPLRSAIFTTPQPEVRLVRVEVWSGTPSRFKLKIKAKAGQPTRDSVAGWEVWAGKLELPSPIFDGYVDVVNDDIRVWGYSPYAPISADADVVPVSAELELAIRTFCRVEGMRRLIGSRVLFKQWQTKSNNADVTIGQLNSDLQVAEDQWRRLSRALKVPEQNPD
jgi:hypothetical protein